MTYSILRSGRACQKKDWAVHKKDCEGLCEMRKLYRRCVNDSSGLNEAMGLPLTAEEKRKLLEIYAIKDTNTDPLVVSKNTLCVMELANDEGAEIAERRARRRSTQRRRDKKSGATASDASWKSACEYACGFEGTPAEAREHTKRCFYAPPRAIKLEPARRRKVIATVRHVLHALCQEFWTLRLDGTETTRKKLCVGGGSDRIFELDVCHHCGFEGTPESLEKHKQMHRDEDDHQSKDVELAGEKEVMARRPIVDRFWSKKDENERGCGTGGGGLAGGELWHGARTLSPVAISIRVYSVLGDNEKSLEGDGDYDGGSGDEKDRAHVLLSFPRGKGGRPTTAFGGVFLPLAGNSLISLDGVRSGDDDHSRALTKLGKAVCGRARDDLILGIITGSGTLEERDEREARREEKKKRDKSKSKKKKKKKRKIAGGFGADGEAAWSPGWSNDDDDDDDDDDDLLFWQRGSSYRTRGTLGDPLSLLPSVVLSGMLSEVGTISGRIAAGQDCGAVLHHACSCDEDEVRSAAPDPIDRASSHTPYFITVGRFLGHPSTCHHTARNKMQHDIHGTIQTRTTGCQTSPIPRRVCECTHGRVQRDSIAPDLPRRKAKIDEDACGRGGRR